MPHQKDCEPECCVHCSVLHMLQWSSWQASNLLALKAVLCTDLLCVRVLYTKVLAESLPNQAGDAGSNHSILSGQEFGESDSYRRV